MHNFKYSTKATRLTVLSISLLLIVGGVWYLESLKPERISGESVTKTVSVQTMDKKEKATKYPSAVELVNPQGYINTDGKPIAIQEHIGKKIILVDFWTYSCINCQRTTPYLNAWYEKYRDKGFEIVGVHTPEFEFEKDYQNVVTAVAKYGIKYPVVQDNNYATWNAYKNRYWPRKYLIDIDGYIVYDHIGEGAYEETEKKIQELLSERMAVLGEKGSIDETLTKETPLTRPESPETYFGAMRNNNIGNGTYGKRGIQIFVAPQKFESNKFYLDGEWNIAGEYAENTKPGAKIIFNYKAKDVYFVASSESGAKVKILIDGRLISIPGEDVSMDGTVSIKEDRLYKLVSGKTIEEHTLEIIIESGNLKAFTFTFG